MKYEYDYVMDHDPDVVKTRLNEMGQDGWMVACAVLEPPGEYDRPGRGPYHILYLVRVRDETPPPLRVVPADFPDKKGS